MLLTTSALTTDERDESEQRHYNHAMNIIIFYCISSCKINFCQTNDKLYSRLVDKVVHSNNKVVKAMLVSYTYYRQGWYKVVVTISLQAWHNHVNKVVTT